MRVQRIPIPRGPAGTAITVDHLKRMVKAAWRDPRFRLAALGLVRGCGGRDLVCQLTALRAWLLSVWRFRRDPYGVELVHSPQRILDTIARQGYFEGDCDDAAVLAAALAGVLGFRVRFKLLGFWNLHYWSHIFTEAYGPYGWFDFDITRPVSRPAPTAVKDVDI